MTHRRLCCGAVLLCILTLGCSVLAPLPDRSRFFNLAALATVAEDAETPHHSAAGTPAPLYGLGPVTLPPYLDRREIAMRVSPTEVAYSPTERWAEPLSDTFTAVLLQDLSLLLDTNRILSYPWSATERVDYQIAVDVLQFDNDVAGNTRLIARWRVRDVRTATDLLAEQTNVAHTQPRGDVNAGITALSAALRDLSQDIAHALRHLPPPAAQPPAATRRM